MRLTSEASSGARKSGRKVKLMKKCLSLFGALAFVLMSTGCAKLRARVEIRTGNDFYQKEQYGDALKHYEQARAIDASFPELDRLIGYSAIGLYKPDNKDPENEKHADRAIQELQKYLQKRPDDEAAREALINLFLNANRIPQAIQYFEAYLKQHPGDLAAVKSIATLYAKQGDFPQALNWYKKITLLDSKNPEAFYVYGVVLYEKVSKDPPIDQVTFQPIIADVMNYIEEGKQALNQAISLKPDYFEALVYLNLMYRQQAKFETDPVKQQESMAKADEYRNKAVAITRARKGQAKA